MVISLLPTFLLTFKILCLPVILHKARQNINAQRSIQHFALLTGEGEMG